MNCPQLNLPIFPAPSSAVLMALAIQGTRTAASVWQREATIRLSCGTRICPTLNAARPFLRAIRDDGFPIMAMAVAEGSYKIISFETIN